MRRIFYFSLLSMGFLLILGVYHLTRFSDNKFHLIFCNVGQGDGVLMRSPKGIDVIVDGGPRENSMTECATRHLPFWDRTIEAVFLTHPDADHLTGLIGIIKAYNVQFFGMSEAPKSTGANAELMMLLQEKKIKQQYLFQKDLIKTKDGVSLFTYWPVRNASQRDAGGPTHEFFRLESKDTNEYSLVQLVSFGKFRALLTGDIPSTYLNSIMPQIPSLDILKPPHHGSKTGTDKFTFQHLLPRLAVLSYGYKNRYGHPSLEVLNLLKRFKIPHKDTLKGDVEIVSDGMKWWVK